FLEIEDLRARGMEHDLLLVAVELTAIAHETELDGTAAGGPGQAQLGEMIAIVERDQRGVLDVVRRIEQSPDERLERDGIAEKAAQLIEDVSSVIDQDAAARLGMFGAPRRRPVGIAGIRADAGNLILGEADPPQPRQQVTDGPPLG